MSKSSKYLPKVAIVPFDSIVIGERFRKDYGNINDLIIDIRVNGLISPVAVCELGNGKYKLLAGGRRMAACAEVSAIRDHGMPVRIYPKELTELEIRSIELAENLKRLNLSPVEQIALKAEIHKLQCSRVGKKDPTNPEGWTITKTADLIGESVSSVSKALELADYIELIPELKDCKTQDEVRKVVEGLQKKFFRGKIVAELEKKKLSTPIGKAQALLADCYHVGDFLDLSSKIESESVDLIECDPPYSIDLKRAKKLDNANLSHNLTSSYVEVPAAEYPQWLREVLSECYRIGKPNSWLVLWFAPEPWFEVVYKIATEVGYSGRRLVGSWYKRQGQAKHPEIYLANDREDFFYFAKGKPKLAKARTATYDYRPINSSEKEHATEKPIELYEDLISTFVTEGSNILSPFLGSGNVLLAAANYGCEGFGYDLNQEHKESFTIKVFNSEPGKYSSYNNK